MNEFYPAFGEVLSVDWTLRLLTVKFLEPPPFGNVCLSFDACPEWMWTEGVSFEAWATLRERDPARFEIKDFER